MTNADYIRNMSDDELVQFLVENFVCEPEGGCPVIDCYGFNCKAHILKWLQEERQAE